MDDFSFGRSLRTARSPEVNEPSTPRPKRPSQVQDKTCENLSKHARADLIDQHSMKVVGCTKCYGKGTCRMWFDKTLGNKKLKCLNCLRTNHACSNTLLGMIVVLFLKESETRGIEDIGRLFEGPMQEWAPRVGFSDYQIATLRNVLARQTLATAQVEMNAARLGLLTRKSVLHSTLDDSPEIQQQMHTAAAITNADVSQSFFQPQLLSSTELATSVPAPSSTSHPQRAIGQ